MSFPSRSRCLRMPRCPRSGRQRQPPRGHGSCVGGRCGRHAGMTTSLTGMLPSGTGTSSGRHRNRARHRARRGDDPARGRPASMRLAECSVAAPRSPSDRFGRWPSACLPATPRSGRLLRDRDRPVGAVGQAGGLGEAGKASATRALASFIGLPAPGLLGSAIRSHRHFSAGRRSSAAQTQQTTLAIFIDKASGQSFADSA